MTDLTQPIAFLKPEKPVVSENSISENNISENNISESKAALKTTFRRSKRLTREDIEIIDALEAVKSDMEFLHNCFDHTTDAVLVDSLVYELKAANLKFQYYLNLCKEKGIVHGAMPKK
ncbi:MAG: YaaL family protein [Defluviitaleaceae bacterium]|nr:YaaL family protein [Defluviitaleaceae bacterium]